MMLSQERERAAYQVARVRDICTAIEIALRDSAPVSRCGTKMLKSGTSGRMRWVVRSTTS